MKITNIRVIGQNLPVSHVALVEVETDEGSVGVGATSAPIPVIAALVGDLAPLLIGQDPSRPENLWRTMFERWQAQRGRGGEGGVAVNAMAAIDMALWDVTGKTANKPVHALVGGAKQRRIMVYASATYYDYVGSLRAGRTVWKSVDTLVQESKAYVEQGFKAIKFGWANHYAPEDLDKLAAMREAIGPDVRLMLDFGCPAYLDEHWSIERAVDVLQRLEPFDLYFFEEALHPYDVDGFASLKQQSRTRIATGESLVTLRDFDRFTDSVAVDVIQPDAQQIGITTFRDVAAHAERAGMLCVPHCPWTALAVAAHLQVLSTFNSETMIEYPAMAGFEDVPFEFQFNDAMNMRIIETPPAVRDGYLELNDRPGLGLGQFVVDVIEELESLERVRYP